MRSIFFADLTHDAQGVSAATFPLGIAYVLSYARQRFKSNFDFRLFKFPAHLNEALSKTNPALLCFSNYSWNLELACGFAGAAKRRDPRLITVFGGPNFPTDAAEKRDFLASRPEIDFYVEGEGELGFAELLARLQSLGLDAQALRASGERLANVAYLREGELISGSTERIRDLSVLPSPYLSGVLDEFFAYPLVPMVETTRGCPFSCSFCADGIASKNKVARHGDARLQEELEYIATRLQNIDELIVTDLNFAMYPEDIRSAQLIAETRHRHGWPTLISASAGKNRPERTIEVAKILRGAWTLGASIQSTDPEVLKAIRRQNISGEAYSKLIDYGNSLEFSKTHSEIILGLPGDTRAKHFESLRFGVEKRVNSMRMFQAMLLRGTEMATPATRARFGLLTSFRTIPGCVGYYEILGQKYPVSEIEEIITGSNTLSFDDYIDCRIMNLLVETFYNNAIFDELYAMLDAMGVSRFEPLLHLKSHPERYSGRMKSLLAEFVKQTSQDLYRSREEALARTLTPEVIERYIAGELGINELLVHRALLYREFDELVDLIFGSVEATLEACSRLTPSARLYLKELRRFVTLRKKNCIGHTDLVEEDSFSFDFLAIDRQGYRVDPDRWPARASPWKCRFFHTETQRRHIANQLRVYANTPIGLGRLIQRSNLKLFYRTVAQVETAAPAGQAAAR